MKRAATIQDFSCIGKCSLTVAIPIISAMGVECCGIPTAVLSNHTGFPSFYSHDLTGDIPKISEQLSVHKITFDAISTGYIASIEQMALIEEFIREFRRTDTLIFVDPVMGDYGRLYSQITGEYAEKMRGLCAHADVITPNLTEAFMLLGEEYTAQVGRSDIRKMLECLVGLGAKNAVITGVAFGNDIVCTGFDGENFYERSNTMYNVSCSGTGDLFSAVMLGAMMNGWGFAGGLDLAVKISGEAARLTSLDPDRPPYGIYFEQAIPYLIEQLEKHNGKS